MLPSIFSHLRKQQEPEGQGHFHPCSSLMQGRFRSQKLTPEIVSLHSEKSSHLQRCRSHRGSKGGSNSLLYYVPLSNHISAFFLKVTLRISQAYLFLWVFNFLVLHAIETILDKSLCFSLLNMFSIKPSGRWGKEYFSFTIVSGT